MSKLLIIIYIYIYAIKTYLYNYFVINNNWRFINLYHTLSYRKRQYPVFHISSLSNLTLSIYFILLAKEPPFIINMFFEAII